VSGSYRDRFHIPKSADGNDCVYLCGHSLGLQPKSARHYIEQELTDWERLGVEGHFRASHPWVGYGALLAEKTACLVGAKPLEVVTMNSLTVNLHLMMVSFYRPTRQRHRVVVEDFAFPSDQYAVKSQIRYHGFDPLESLVTVSGEDELDELLDREGESIALILMGGINYSSGTAFDMSRLTRAGHAKGCLVGFDLAHAAGNLVLELHHWEVDFAAWCTYKYLNGGPGCIAGCFVHERHALDPTLPRFAGWWGHDPATRFRMGPDFEPAPGAAGWQVSNPPVLALAALRASLDLFAEAGIERLRAESIELTGYLESLLLPHAGEWFTITTPSDPERRGAQLSIRLRRPVQAIHEKLRQRGVICDWREPDILRVAPAPLYNTQADIHNFVDVFLS
jgi:kynureninase